MDETWITLTADHAREALADTELDVFTNAALEPGENPVLGGALRRVANRIRSEVGASGRYDLGPDGTIPPELEGAALHLLRRELASRIPQPGLERDRTREAGLEDAERQLDRVREGKAGLSRPATVSTTAPARDTGAWGSQNAIDFSDGPP